MADAGATRTVAYGEHPEQVADLSVPAASPPLTGWPVVALVHGGFWRQRYARDLMGPLATDLTARGHATWNIEYRRVGGDGGWPTTLTDVAAALDHLEVVTSGQDAAPLDLDRLAVVGHSAGGHLALWVAGRGRLPPGAPGGAPRVVPRLAVGQAAVADLAAALELGDGAVIDLLDGSPDEVAERYRVADPVALVGHGVPVLLTHGEDDEDVPVELSHRYARAAAAAGDRVEVVVRPGDHDAVIDPNDALWEAVLAALDELGRRRTVP